LIQSSNSVLPPLPTSACLRSCSNSVVPTVLLPPRVTVTSNSTLSSILSNVSTSAPCAPSVYELVPGSTSTFHTPTNSALPSSIVSDLERCLVATPQLPIVHSDVPFVQGSSAPTRRFKPTSVHMPPNPSVTTPAPIAHSHLSSVPRSRSISSLIVRARARSSVPSAPVRSQGVPILPPTSGPTTIVVHDNSHAPTASIAPTGATTWNHTLSHAIKSSVPQNNVFPGKVEFSLPSDGMHRVRSLHSTMKHSLLPTPSKQVPRPTHHLNEVIQSRRSVMKPSSSIARCLQALMGSLMERGDESLGLAMMD